MAQAESGGERENSPQTPVPCCGLKWTPCNPPLYTATAGSLDLFQRRRRIAFGSRSGVKGCRSIDSIGLKIARSLMKIFGCFQENRQRRLGLKELESRVLVRLRAPRNAPLVAFFAGTRVNLSTFEQRKKETKENNHVYRSETANEKSRASRVAKKFKRTTNSNYILYSWLFFDKLPRYYTRGENQKYK